MSILAIARDQASDLIRRRYLIVILILVLGIVGMFTMYLAMLRAFTEGPSRMPGSGVDQRQFQSMMAMALAAWQGILHVVVSFAGTALTLMLMCCSVRSEVSKGTVRMILCRPVKRYEFVLGKWLGCVFIAFIFYTLAGGMVCIYTHRVFGQLVDVVPLSIATSFLKAVMVGSVGMALSMYMSPILSGMVAYFAAGETFLFIASTFLRGTTAHLVNIPFYILPSYKALNMYTSVMNGVRPGTADIAYRVAYAILFSALMLVITSVVFQRKDLV
jgi:ABC-type transport system involved in multi-copper enzyme maturation permease subunit